MNKINDDEECFLFVVKDYDYLRWRVKILKDEINDVLYRIIWL